MATSLSRSERWRSRMFFKRFQTRPETAHQILVERRSERESDVAILNLRFSPLAAPPLTFVWIGRRPQKNGPVFWRFADLNRPAKRTAARTMGRASPRGRL